MNTTRKYPRTLEEAFGPYERGDIQEPQDPMPTADAIILWISAVAVACVAVMAIIGLLPGGAA